MRVKFPFVLRTVHVLFRVTKRFSVRGRVKLAIEKRTGSGKGVSSGVQL